MALVDSTRFPNTSRIVTAVERFWPDHALFLEQSFSRRDEGPMAVSERHSQAILQVIGSEAALEQYCADYRFMCEKFVEEEVYFRRNGTYRLSRFKDAESEVYANAEFMSKYMKFLLLSHVLWINHANATAHFQYKYLPRLPKGTDHLEIGPGHGLLLHLAAQSPAIASVTGWDVSQTSIAQTRHCLEAMGESRPVRLTLQNLFDAPSPAAGAAGTFGSVVISEVLEHLEDPVAALKGVARHLHPEALLWVNVPINSPAPDHIYLLRTPEEAVDLVKAGGFEPLDSAFYPMTGYTLERARKWEVTISAVVSARLSK